MFIGKLMQKKVLAGFGLIAHPRSYESKVIYCTFFIKKEMESLGIDAIGNSWFYCTKIGSWYYLWQFL